MTIECHEIWGEIMRRDGELPAEPSPGAGRIDQKPGGHLTLSCNDPRYPASVRHERARHKIAPDCGSDSAGLLDQDRMELMAPKCVAEPWTALVGSVGDELLGAFATNFVSAVARERESGDALGGPEHPE